MSDLRFEIGDWTQSDDPDPRRAYTAAELIVFVDDIPATKLFDSRSRTVTDRARLPLYPLAEWFASNWWRLHAEAAYDGYPPLDWRLSHDLPSIGGGFVWPRMRFASDDRTIQVSAQVVPSAAWEPVQHLNDIRPARSVTVAAFDRAIEQLVSTVLLRLTELGISAEPLTAIWSDVQAERADAEIAAWRHWEARLGYDPGQASDDVMARVEGLLDHVGRSAAAEVAPLLISKDAGTFDDLEALAAGPGIEARMPSLGVTLEQGLDVAPWDVGRLMARAVRDKLALPSGPITDGVLDDLLGTGISFIDAPLNGKAPISLGVRMPDHGTTLHFRKRNPVGRRFEAARFLADSLVAAEDDTWLPLTDRATARQKVQRAFAAEFLAPITEIGEAVGEARTQDRFEEVADHYGVSPLAIRSQLANHGLLTPDEVGI